MAIQRRKTAKGITYDVRIRDLGGKHRSKGFRHLKEAQQFERTLLAQKAREEFPEVFGKKRRLIFDQLAHKWLQIHSKVSKSPKSHKRDLGVVCNYLVPFFGGRIANRIKSQDVQEYLSQRLNTVSPKTGRLPTPATLNREFEIVRKIFSDGVAWGDLVANPCQGMKKLKERPRKFEFLRDAEIAAVLRSCDERDRNFFATAIYTGMRLGELVNLKKNNVDLVHRQITVEIGSAESGTTKSGKLRQVSIAAALLRYLQDQMQTRGEYLFPSKLDESQRRTEVRKALASTLKRAGIERHFRFHDFRHTFASHFVMKGGDLMALKEILGHSSLQMVQRYAHLAPDHLQKGIDRLNFEESPLPIVSEVVKETVRIQKPSIN